MPTENISNISYITVNQVMGKPPSWIVYWGISVIGIFIIIALGTTAFIRYPDVLQTQAVAYVDEIPIEIFSQQQGVIHSVLVNENQEVAYYEPLIVLESGANWTKVLELDTLLKRGKGLFRDEKLLVPADQLGVLQASYQNLLLIERKMKYHQQHDITQQKVQGVEQELIDNQALHQSLIEQQELYKQELKILQKDVQRMRDLEASGTISTQELEQQENIYLQKERGFQSLKSNLITLEMSSKKIQLSKLEYAKNKTDLFENIQQEHAQQKARLQVAIEDWKRQHLIFAPCSGQIVFPQRLVNGSLVKNEQVLVTILPTAQQKKCFLEASVAASGIGKLEVGYKAKVAFENYPSNEFGILTARVSKIAVIPNLKKQSYQVTLQLPKDWTTNYGIVIPKRSGMAASIRIQTKEYTLLERVFAGLLDVLKN